MTQIPLPQPTAYSRPYWERCNNGQLAAPQCDECGNLFFPPRAVCPECLSPDVTYRDSCGRGVVYSYTVIERAPGPEFETPYAVAVVEVAEGWHIGTNIIRCDPHDVYIGMEVEVEFRQMSEQITLPYFRPVTANGQQ